MRVERDRAGGQRQPDDGRARGLGARPGAGGARLDLRAQRRAAPRPGHVRDGGGRARRLLRVGAGTSRSNHPNESLSCDV